MPQKSLWTIRESEAATGMKSWAIAQHLHNGTLALDEAERGDVDAKGRGKVRRLAEATIIDIAGGAELSRLGIGFATGNKMMWQFTMRGDAGQFGPARDPAKPYPSGETYLLALPTGRAAVVSALNEVQSDRFHSMIVDAGTEFQSAEGAGRAIAILNVRQLYERVRLSLGLDPHDYRRRVGEAV